MYFFVRMLELHFFVHTLESQREDNSIENKSTLFKFTKKKFDKNNSSDVSDDDNYSNNKQKPNGKGSFVRRGNTKFNLDCYGMDIAPMNIFENQVIPMGIGNISKSFTANLNTFRIFGNKIDS